MWGMSLALVGLGLVGKLNEEGIEILEKGDEIYCELYTSFLPSGALRRLEQRFGNIIMLERSDVESDFLIKRAKERNVVLLVGGDPLFATTHQILIDDCIKKGIRAKVVHNTSVLSAIAKTGLSLYNFGKIATLSFWTPSYKPTRPVDVIEKNMSIGAHTLLLCDIGKERGMGIREGIATLKKMLKKEGKENLLKNAELFVCSKLCWEDEKIIRCKWTNAGEIEGNDFPCCFVISNTLNVVENELSLRFKID